MNTEQRLRKKLDLATRVAREALEALENLSNSFRTYEPAPVLSEETREWWEELWWEEYQKTEGQETEKVLERAAKKRIKLNRKESERFVKALKNPKKPTKAFKKAAKNYKKDIKTGRVISR